MGNVSTSIPRLTWAHRTWASARRRLVRWLLRLGLFPTSTRTDSDTMGEWKRLMAEKDDPKPGLVLPDPNAPHAELIRRVRLYAQNGAKALAPLLDRPLPELVPGFDLSQRLQDCEDARQAEQDRTGTADLACAALLDEIELLGAPALYDIHAAYNAPWTVVDGEVYEYESSTRKRVVQ